MFNISEEPKVLLILPTTDDLARSNRHTSVAPAYGLNILATALRKEGLETIVIDEFSIRYIFQLYNIDSWIEAVEIILSHYKSIKFVGISVLTNFRKTVVKLSTVIKLRRPNIIIAWGGAHVTGLGELLFKKYKSNIDIMVSGVTDFDIISYFKERILSTRLITESIFLIGNPTKDISKLIFPDYSQYIGIFETTIPKIITRTSTGCPTSNCVFCSAHFLEGKYFTSDDITIQNEINRLITIGTKRIEFHDQDLCYDFDRLNKILPLKSFSNIEECYCHADLNSLTKRHLDFFINTKVQWKIFIGLESASNEVRQYLGKRIHNNITQHLIDLNEYILGTNVHIGLFIMCGVPIERSCHIQETIELLKNLNNIDISFSLLKVFPGTQIAQKLIKEGKIDINIWIDENGPQIVTAINGDQLQQTIANWKEILTLFPFARDHNQIDQMLLNI